MVILARTRLRNLLSEAIKSPLVSVTAPPGYGKTQTVADFIFHSGLQSIWTKVVSLDKDPIRFWDSFTLAAMEKLPGLAARLRDLGFPRTAPGIFDFMHILDEETAGSLPVIFVFDDFGRVAEGPVGRLLEHVLQAEPGDCRFILISSTKTGMDVAGLKSNGVFQITSKDLRFTELEAREYYMSAGVSVSASDVNRIIKFTEGWPMALRLLDPPPDQVHRIPPGNGAGTHSFIIESDGFSKYEGILTPEALSMKFEIIQSIFEVDYFYCYDEEVRSALIKLSLLPSFILENLKDTGILRRHQAVESIMSNLFISYNPETRLHTMHNMYREFLKGWQSTLSEAEKNEFRLAAGVTFMERSCFLEAIDCFGKCCCYSEMLTALVKRYCVKADAVVEDSDYIMSISEQFPRGFRNQNPLVDYMRAVIYYVNNEIEQCETTLKALIDRLKGSDEQHLEMLGNAYFILGCIRILRSKEDFGTYFMQSKLHLQAAHIDESELLKLLFFHVGNCSIIGMDGKDAGALERMEKAIEENMPCFKELSGGGDGLNLLFSAEAAFHTLNLESAKLYAQKAMQEASENDQHDIYLNSAFILTRVALMCGDYPEMNKQVSLITDYVDYHDATMLRVFRDSVLSWLYLIMGLPGMVPPVVMNPGISRKNSRFTPRCRVNLLHAYYLIARGEYGKLISHINKMEGKHTRWIDRLNIHILRAMAERRMGNIDGAMKALQKAYEMTRENGIVAPFVELGFPMYSLAEQAKKDDSLGFDSNWLDYISGKSASFAKRLSIVAKEFYAASRDSSIKGVRLTKREMEVLSDLSLGKTREEIARSNYISINTVKSVIKNIYAKLGAVNRADAIRISTNLGILEGKIPNH